MTCDYGEKIFVFHDNEKSTLWLKVTKVKHTLQTKRGMQHFHCMQMHWLQSKMGFETVKRFLSDSVGLGGYFRG